MLVRLCDAQDLPITGAKRFDVDQARLAVVRTSNGSIFVIDDECSHADFSLSEGEVDSEDNTIECPKHGALFDIVTGEPECLPATKPIATYSWEMQNGELFVELENE